MAVDTLSFRPQWPAGTQTGTYPIPLVKPTIAGFIGRTERGPLNEPVVVKSFAEFCRNFGGDFTGSSVPQVVQDFFLHGGSMAVMVRVANRATRARIEIPAGDEWLVLRASQPGRQEILRASIDYEGVEDDPDHFTLVVQRLRSHNSQLVADQELFPLISMRRSDDRFIGDALAESRMVGLGGPLPSQRPDETPPDHPGSAIKYIQLTYPGTDGDELTDYDIIGSNNESTGLFAFERGPRLDLLCIPLSSDRDLGMTAFVAAERFCREQRTIMIWDPPWSWDSVDMAIMGARQMDCASPNVVTYFPRIRPRGERARFGAGLPACGAIAGMLAQHDRGGVWQPESHGDFVLKTAFTAVQELSPQQISMLQRNGISTFVRAAGGNTQWQGNVTVGGSGVSSKVRSRLDRQRLRFLILNAVEDAGLWAAQHYQADKTMRRLELQVGNFLAALHERDALQGRDPTEAFFVQARGIDGELGCVLRFGFALDRGQDFAEYAVTVAPGEIGAIVRQPVLEAEQLFR